MFESANSVGHLVNKASRSFVRALNRRIEPLGVLSGQIPVLLALANGAAQSQKELVEQSIIEQSTMAATLARMERTGLLLRSKHPTDGRVSQVCLSGMGQSVMDGLYAALDEGNTTALSGFSDKEAAMLKSFLRRIIDNLGVSTG